MLGAIGLGTIAFARGEEPSVLWFIVAAVCAYALGYRFYSAFIAAKVLELDDAHPTPAIRLTNGRDYVPTARWITFGHHFAAIAGPGPLVGPVLAAQFGYLPSTMWIIIGAVLGGCVQDFVILGYSLKRDGRSLGKMASRRDRPGRRTHRARRRADDHDHSDRGARAGRGQRDEAQHVGDLDRRRDGADRDAGRHLHDASAPRPPRRGLDARRRLILLAVSGGRYVEGFSFGSYFVMDAPHLAIWIIGYGFLASVLPIWLLLAPRDYLSAFIKIGTIVALAMGIVAMHPPP